jgi:hypothetical protein
VGLGVPVFRNIFSHSLESRAVAFFLFCAVVEGYMVDDGWSLILTVVDESVLLSSFDDVSSCVMRVGHGVLDIGIAGLSGYGVSLMRCCGGVAIC